MLRRQNLPPFGKQSLAASSLYRHRTWQWPFKPTRRRGGTISVPAFVHGLRSPATLYFLTPSPCWGTPAVSMARQAAKRYKTRFETSNCCRSRAFFAVLARQARAGYSRNGGKTTSSLSRASFCM
jgi:hypothetical protein